jgi:catechol 2,3-dioxygenase-like lactoylglutathione lyase family enzyme
MAMIDHTGIGVANVARSAAFFDAVLGALGLRRVMQLPENEGTDGIGYGVHYPVFWIDRLHPHSLKQHTAFAARNRGEVDSFYAAALRAGGTDNGAPGLRDTFCQIARSVTDFIGIARCRSTLCSEIGMYT